MQQISPVFRREYNSHSLDTSKVLEKEEAEADAETVANAGKGELSAPSKEAVLALELLCLDGELRINEAPLLYEVWMGGGQVADLGKDLFSLRVATASTKPSW